MNVIDTVARPVLVGRGIRALFADRGYQPRGSRTFGPGSCGFMLVVLLELLARRTAYAAMRSFSGMRLSFATTLPLLREDAPDAQTFLPFPRRINSAP